MNADLFLHAFWRRHLLNSILARRYEIAHFVCTSSVVPFTANIRSTYWFEWHISKPSWGKWWHVVSLSPEVQKLKLKVRVFPSRSGLPCTVEVLSNHLYLRVEVEKGHVRLFHDLIWTFIMLTHALCLRPSLFPSQSSSCYISDQHHHLHIILWYKFDQ